MRTIDALPPGESIETMIESITRIKTRLKRRATVAKRRCERDSSARNQEMYLLAAQEFFYMVLVERELLDLSQELSEIRESELKEKLQKKDPFQSN